LSGEVVQPLTSGWILLPGVRKCKRVARFFLQFFYIVLRARPGMAFGMPEARVDSDQPSV
jgi:hypothetical protein